MTLYDIKLLSYSFYTQILVSLPNYIPNIIIPIIKNNSNIGNNTNTHANAVAPPRQMIFNNHVQNNMYTSLMTKTIVVFETSQVYDPKQYIFVFPIFCINITINAIIEITRYTYAGVHRFLNPT
jgi:hypothetical protein